MQTRLIKMTLCALSLIGIYFFCERQTQGFRYYQLLSDLPNDSRWNISPSIETEEINRLIDQTFTYLGKGGFCYAFLGEDQKTILKLFIHTHFHPLSLFENFSYAHLLLKHSITPSLPAHHEFSFKSCMLLYKKIKEKTGLIHVHLNKSDETPKCVTLIDNIGVRHTIDLNQTEFVLQQRAELLIDYIARSVKEHKIDNAELAIDNYLQCLLALCKQGIRDLDHGFRNNYGILDNGAVITIDISSFSEDLSLQRPANYQKEIILKSHNLAKWLKRHQNDLFKYYDQKLIELIENE